MKKLYATTRIDTPMEPAGEQKRTLLVALPSRNPMIGVTPVELTEGLARDLQAAIRAFLDEGPPPEEDE